MFFMVWVGDRGGFRCIYLKIPHMSLLSDNLGTILDSVISLFEGLG